jgi:hypothetical protein
VRLPARILRAASRAALLGALAAGAAASAQGMPLVNEEAITPAARACLGLSDNLSAMRERLAAEGWSRGKFRTADGKSLRDPGKGIEIFGRDGLLLLLTTDPAKLGCVVSAKARPGLDMAKMVFNATAVLGKAPFVHEPKQAMWRLDTGQAVMLRHSVAPDGASIQIVITPVQKKI